MDAEYGVGVKNRFAFLDGDSDDENIPDVPAKPTTITSIGKKPAAKKLLESKNKEAVKLDNNNKVAGGGGGGTGANRSNPKDRAVKGKGQATVSEERKGHTENGAVSDRQQQRQGYGSSRGGGYRRDNQRGGDPNRRNYNNRTRFSDDREGRHENGTDDLQNGGDKNGKDNDENGTTNVDGNEENPEGTQSETTENAKAEEKTLTLAEWKALQAPREKPAFNIRKPGEGEVASKLEKLVLKKREDDLGDHDDEEYEVDEVYYPQRAGKMKLVADVGFTTGYQQKRRGTGRFGASTRIGGGDGGEGNPPNEHRNQDKPRGRPRSGYRGGGHHQRPAQAPRIDDAFDFPTLG